MLHVTCCVLQVTWRESDEALSVIEQSQIQGVSKGAHREPTL